MAEMWVKDRPSSTSSLPRSANSEGATSCSDNNDNSLDNRSGAMADGGAPSVGNELNHHYSPSAASNDPYRAKTTINAAASAAAAAADQPRDVTRVVKILKQNEPLVRRRSVNKFYVDKYSHPLLRVVFF